MGLDMYLNGERFFWQYEKNEKVTGFPKKREILELGYWRKHPNLHGYIVETFADGEDNCQEIELSADDLKKILEASETDKLPHTEGFFFGQSTSDDKKQTKEILTAAIEWLETDEPNVSRSVNYIASW